MSSQLRRLVLKGLPKGSRSITTGRIAKGGEGGYDYEHAPSMYNIFAIKNPELKFGAAIVGLVGGGVGLSIFALMWQQNKAKG